MNKDDQWEGPGVVQGTESKSIWITHNGAMKKVASCRVSPWVDEEDETTDSDDSSDSEREDVVVDNTSHEKDGNVEIDTDESFQKDGNCEDENLQKDGKFEGKDASFQKDGNCEIDDSSNAKEVLIDIEKQQTLRPKQGW